MAKLKDIEVEALKLSAYDRALLAERLINSLESEDDTDVEKLWAEEAERRYKEYKEGKVKVRPAAEVIGEAFSKLQ